MRKIIYLVLLLSSATLQLSAQYWGDNNMRTETRDNADSSGTGIRSGFYQSLNPLHYPAGSTGWWHLLEVRNNNPSYNFAMQFAGAWTDQFLYFRKTANDLNQAKWSRVLMETPGLGEPGAPGIGFSKFAGGSWINLPTSGPSGLGSGGPGADAWIGYSSQANTWFNNAIAGDICYRNKNGRMLFGNAESPGAIMAVSGNKVGIGTLTPTEVLTVSGNIKNSGNLSVYGNIKDSGNLSVYGNITAKKLQITQTPWADYVFDPSYKLRTLREVEDHITKYKHLPDVPSARQIEAEGIDVGSSQATLLKKIEELTLYVIEQNKRLEQQQKQMDELKKQVGALRR